MKISNVLSACLEVYKTRGIFYLIRSGIYSIFFFVFYKIRRQNTFSLQGRKYQYFCSLPNSTWLNERSVEIPIMMDIVSKYHSRKILEIGNVLSNYFNFEHDIVDKYEIKDGVINQDVVDFKRPEKYDLIVSISTLEHVGWDEIPREEMKIPRVIQNLKGLVRPKDGMIIVTLPLGYNMALDRIIRDGLIQFTSEYYLRRVSKNNRWEEVSKKAVQNAKYVNGRYPHATGLLVGIIKT